MLIFYTWLHRFLDSHDLIRRDLAQLLNRAAGPMDFYLLDLCVFSEPEMQALGILPPVMHAAVLNPHLSNAACRNVNASPYPVPV